jgi:hypothetical protein
MSHNEVASFLSCMQHLWIFITLLSVRYRLSTGLGLSARDDEDWIYFSTFIVSNKIDIVLATCIKMVVQKLCFA